MSVTEILMKPGQFNLALREDAPRSVWQAAALFDHILITPTRLPPAAITDTNLKAAAIYTGVILDKPRGIELIGAGLGHWLGTDKGGGDILTAGVTLTAANLSTAITALRPISVNAGTVTNPGGTITHAFQWMTRREAIDYVCKSLGAEWRINPNNTLDAAAPATLFRFTPTVIIQRKPEGMDRSLRGLEATKLEQSSDVVDYARTITVVAQQGDGAKVATATAIGSNLFKDFNNNNVILERLVNAPDASVGSASGYASGLLTNYATARKGVSLSSREYAVTSHVDPGDWVYVYDEEAELYDTANLIYWRGRYIAPIKLRVRSITWPVTRRMGVYARRSGATPIITDLTDWMKWEGGDTTWEVGTGLLDPDQGDTNFSAAYLGANPDVLDRVRTGAIRTYTPTFTGTVVNGTLLGDYRVIGDMAEGNIIYVRGSSDTHGAGLIAFGLPTGLTTSMQDGAWVGGARLIDATGPTNFMRHAYLGGGVIGMMAENGAAVSNTVPFTIATGDQYILQWKVRLA